MSTDASHPADEAPTAALTPTVLGGRYELIAALGKGGFGTVWRAKDRRLERQVAVKVVESASLGAEQRARFLREARALARLQHPNVVALYDAGEDGERMFLVLELIEGGPLGGSLAVSALSPARATDVLRQIATGLASAHALGIVHRDIKPGNVLLSSTGAIKLSDFGLAQLHDESRLTSAGMVLGTPAYMSPEQIEGRTATAASDIFALGCVAYELVTGRSPFGSGRHSEVVARILAGRPAPFPSAIQAAAPGYCALVERMLAKDPARRPQTAQEVLAELDRPPAGPTRGRARRLALGVVAIAALAIVLIWPPRRAPFDPGEIPPLRRSDAGIVAPTNAPPQVLYSATTELGLDHRPVTLTVKNEDIAKVLARLAASHRLSFVLDPTIGLPDRRHLVTIDLKDVEPDLALRSILEQSGLGFLRFGHFLFIGEPTRVAELAALRPPVFVIERPTVKSAASMAQMLAAVAGDTGVVVENRRLGAVVLLDREEKLFEYEKIWNALSSPLADPADFYGRRFSGEPISLHLTSASLDDVLRSLGQLLGVSFSQAASVRGRVTAELVELAWDNAFELLVLANGLEYELSGNTIHLRPATASFTEMAVETIRLEHEPPEFFLPFQKALTPAGSLAIDAGSKTVVVRDVRSRTLWFAGFVRAVDRAQPPAP